ncbi:methyltransferase domain-containing protein [Streptomyces sp. NPDC050560]|uniref:methyltransferase domain-containing protein n=1 Tax=Streptomyces sp. NPDC050560 TaxID=3365630 RepID=UPI00379C1251
MSKNREAQRENQEAPRAVEEPRRDTASLLALLDATDLRPDMAGLRARSYELLSPAPGSTVVDVGCGAGRAVAELAGRGVRAVGVDPDPGMLAAAGTRWPTAEFREAGALALPFADGSVDGYRADKVFHVLEEPGRAVAEARRVLAPGGRIVLAGQDWDAFVIEADDAALTRTLVRACAARLGSPRVARGYRNLLLDGGFDDVTVEVHHHLFTGNAALPLLARIADGARAGGAVGRGAADGWLAEQRRRAEADRCLLALPVFVAAAFAPV